MWTSSNLDDLDVSVGSDLATFTIIYAVTNGAHGGEMAWKGSPCSVAVIGIILASAFSALMVAVPEGASAYTSSSPIYIQSNLDFDAGHGVVGGAGTEADPYVIDGWEIVTTGYGYGIIVANTDKYFTIRDCYIHGVSWDGSHAIYLTNVKHGTVQDCLLTDAHRGIDMRSSSFIGITGCNISGCGSGMHSETSSDVNISDCLIQGNGVGFAQQASACWNYTFINNNITGNSRGITAYPASNYTIERNNVSRNYGTGIYLADCDECLIKDNYFGGNNELGLMLSSATNMTLTSNLFVDDGLQVWGENVTYWNTQTMGEDNLVNGLPLLYLKDSDSVVVDGDPIGALILANCTGALVTNLTIGGTCIPVAAGYSDQLTVKNSTFEEEYMGVFLSSCSHAVIQNNSIVNATLDAYRSYSMESGLGIFANACPALQIAGNNITHPDIGILLRDCPDATVDGNRISVGNFAKGIMGMQCDNALLLANEVSLKDGGIKWTDSRNVTMTGNVVSDSRNEAVYLENVTDLMIVANEFLGNGFGLRLSDTVNVSFIGNSVTGTFCSYNPSADWPCLQLSDSEDIELTGNTLSGNDNGLYMYNCDSVVIVGNNCSSEENEGVYLEWCRDLSVSLNNVSSNGVYGIHLRSCDGIQSVADNLVSDNPIGMYFDMSAPEVTGNSIVANGVGLELLSTGGVSAYHNDFIANAVHVIASGSLVSTWDDSYPNGGNYWSDYSGDDECSGPDQDVIGADGIGDSPHTVYSDIEDNYPLMRPVNVLDAEPVAYFFVDQLVGDVTSAFQLNASGVWDREDSDDALEVRWDFDGDGVWDTEWTTDKDACCEFAAPGTYNVTLEVKDCNGSTNMSVVQVVVTEAIPEFSSTAVLTVVMVTMAAIMVGIKRRRGNR
jgi:parallel beta-helix repeat protein